ncbi:hypothetical protein [Enterovibrio baiacu]|uniref:hypothetical protein n=1 Tax=Enterovibrio baiacu TaxID=2491023 RepID=UPI003D09A056
MDCEIGVFLCSAISEDGNSSGYPKGERHEAMFLVRQEKGFYNDFDNAERVAETVEGWRDFKFTKVGLGNLDRIKSNNNFDMAEAYESAMENGSCLIIYSKVID